MCVTTGAKSRPRQKLVIYAPATPSSIPILLAAQQMDAEVTIFTNHTQANAQFLRGDVDILVTGLSVGIDMFKNGAPVQAIDSYVAGLTYLVTYGKKVERFADLKGQEIYFPFEGSPIEEITQFFIAQEGLAWKTDIKPIYSPFASSVELLKQGKATAVALPEPSVSLIANQPNLYISLDYRALWDKATGSTTGYPQVTPLVKQEWAAAHAGRDCPLQRRSGGRGQDDPRKPGRSRDADSSRVRSAGGNPEQRIAAHCFFLQQRRRVDARNPDLLSDHRQAAR